MSSLQKLEAMKIIQEELKELTRNPRSNLGITVGLLDEDNLFEWKCTILGPSDTCYKGGLFILKITFPEDYPNTKPEIVFQTPIYHLNVKFFANGKQPLGHICVLIEFCQNFLLYSVEITQIVHMITMIKEEEMNLLIIELYLKKKLNILLKNMLIH